jgi:hypothetical protein
LPIIPKDASAYISAHIIISSSRSKYSYHTYASNLVRLLLHRIHRLFRTTLATSAIDLETLVGAPICHLCEILQ